jgi:hypothetical protein
VIVPGPRGRCAPRMRHLCSAHGSAGLHRDRPGRRAAVVSGTGGSKRCNESVRITRICSQGRCRPGLACCVYGCPSLHSMPPRMPRVAPHDTFCCLWTSRVAVPARALCAPDTVRTGKQRRGFAVSRRFSWLGMRRLACSGHRFPLSALCYSLPLLDAVTDSAIDSTAARMRKDPVACDAGDSDRASRYRRRRPYDGAVFEKVPRVCVAPWWCLRLDATGSLYISSQHGESHQGDVSLPHSRAGRIIYAYMLLDRPNFSKAAGWLLQTGRNRARSREAALGPFQLLCWRW